MTLLKRPMLSLHFNVYIIVANLFKLPLLRNRETQITQSRKERIKKLL